ncbi:hypothetical protein SUNI508_02253 [Seiridium unicorne]|uniref:Uncharacterized protein n=1 Tax=Seiridium unicorne TaxID=138068 RepID=A0ABR2UHP3_9PEZI
MDFDADQTARHGRGHRWTKFELDIVLGLICKGKHLSCRPITFTTLLNQALNGSRDGLDYDKDIAVEDVCDLLAHIEREKKGSLAFVERQPRPLVMTRTKKRVFERNLPFTGSLEEWAAGRKDEVAAKKERDQRMRDAGLQTTFRNAQGVQIERWVPANGQQSTAQQGKTDTWMAGDSFSGRANEQHLPFGWNNQGNVGTPTPYVHPSTPMMPQPTPMLLHGGWGYPTTTTSAPHVDANANANANANLYMSSWSADPVQARIDAITLQAEQRSSTQQQQPRYGPAWANPPVAADASTSKEYSPPW